MNIPEHLDLETATKLLVQARKLPTKAARMKAVERIHRSYIKTIEDRAIKRGEE